MYLHLVHQSEIVFHKQIKSPEDIFQPGCAAKKYYSTFWSSLFGNHLIIFLAKIPHLRS